MSDTGQLSISSRTSEETITMANVPKENDRLATLPFRRKIALTAFLCLAPFLDTLANASLFAAFPPISLDLGISNSNAVWIVSGYQLTFAALLLGSGRMSDLYNSKYVFLTGVAFLSAFSLGTGFARDEVTLFILRAFMGVGAALTVPSALHLIIHLFPDPAQQSKAIAVFGGFGALGNVFGLLVGAFIIQWTTWPWLFYVFCITGTVVFVAVALLSPSPERAIVVSNMERLKRLDLGGIFLVTAGLVLFIFGVTAGSVNGWTSARCLAPLIVSVFPMTAFFFWEARLPEEQAAIPPNLWRVRNFTVLVVGSATMHYWWFGVVQFMFSWVWQNVYHWSPIITALRFLPVGVFACVATLTISFLRKRFPLKWVLVSAQSIALVATILLTFGDSPQRYFPVVLPGFILGAFGIGTAFLSVNIAVFASTPPEKAGVVGSIFNCFQQLGSAAGSAIVTSIQTSVEVNHGGPTSFFGRRVGLWFQVGLLAISTICLLIFMHNDIPPKKQAVGDKEKGLDTPAEKDSDLAEKEGE
ncbi:hypothetical protein AGABI1DRAFT_126582 [Agaricus bisporus var. burnettii JB137-S8]|uniref:Major facilitator superfamily (MFS) profile domain-containing protein n=1 Tax=Agaricus bisporus var. burnettii (strain JB137-S8 / ATCC MYA-4627 / FGSC 10392) TaxID=597362 RepID=K5XG79_AGABU|nr:uncharacterized protein AGABI1DRAFT_126582 [Agaricus bisporus var. burnettii JB137-S8]EKM82252.1 hypothetical protein AGABI1DRAFT_126582 [Agaricus bisporus var. burnettii JB137-S8]